MRRIGVLTLLLFCALVTARAQVTVEVVTEQEQFLLGESLPAAVKITNRSGKTLRLGTDNTWLSFLVEERDAAVVSVLDEVPVSGAFDLESSKRATKEVDLAPYFALDKVGRYLITAIVTVKDLDREFRSLPKGIDIIEGTRIWEREVGIPNSAGTNATPEIRKYILQQANYLKGRLRLYLRVTDGLGHKTIKLQPVGNLVSFSKPDPQVASDGNLHLLYQYGPQAFNYTVFTPDGTLLVRQTHDYTDKRPRLKMDNDGAIVVVGGLRRELPTDIPPPPKEEEPKPAAQTNQSQVPARQP